VDASARAEGATGDLSVCSPLAYEGLMAMTDAELWERFTRQDIAHSDLDEAHLRLRAGIIRLNHRHGLEESATRGYFETLTRVWLHLVACAMAETQVTTSLALLARCPELLDPRLPLRHYSKERLDSPKARAIFLPPDREPLPESAAAAR